MKLAKDEIVRTGDADPLDLFNQGIKSEATREKYTRTLRMIVCEFLEDILEGEFEDRVRQLVTHGKEDPDWTRDLLLNLSRKIRKRTVLEHDDPDYLNPTTVPNYFKPVRKLFDMTDVVISWKRIYATYPELDNIATSRGWTREEIGAMVTHSRDSMERAVVLILASSGIRAGGLNLEWRDITPVYISGGKLLLDPGAKDCKIACAMIEVYRGSAESYVTFITPEAYEALQEYGRAWAKRMGRMPKPKDPVFLIKKGIPKRASYKVLTQLLSKTAVRAGLRGGKAKDAKRFDVPLMNGFRRFWNKTCKEALSQDSALASLIKKEFMMGHKGLVPLDKNYFKTNALELAREYMAVVPDLTISDTTRLKQSTKRMSENIQKLESDKDARIRQLEEKVVEMEKVGSVPRNQEKDDRIKQLEAKVAHMERLTTSALDMESRIRASEMNMKEAVKDDVDKLAALLESLKAHYETNMEEVKASKDRQITNLKKTIERLKSSPKSNTLPGHEDDAEFEDGDWLDGHDLPSRSD